MDLFRHYQKKSHLDSMSTLSSENDIEGTSFQFFDITAEEPELRNQLSFFVVFLIMIFSLRIMTTSHLKTLSGEHVLNLHNLNDVNLIKEVFLAYLNAALLEPVLALGNEDTSSVKSLANIFELLSLCWWIWLVSDAFDFNDVMVQYKFHYEFREEIEDDPRKFSFMRLRDRQKESQLERQSFFGSLKRDVALWFMLGSIASAWLPGAVTHRDVLHAYVVVMIWAVMHHYLRRATCWGINYFYTFLFPSTALLPMEYCFPLMDTADVVEDPGFVVTYRQFVLERTGVELIIET